ncbi:MAG: DUF742 domain-containing protein [Nocardioides sp.]
MDEEVVAEASFVRPYMRAEASDAVRPSPATPAPEQADAETDGATVRPYMVTNGRVHDSDDAVEKIYLASEENSGKPRGREHQQVLELCAEAMSVAEISAHLNMPLGVAAVLARDLLNDGLLVSSVEGVDVTSDVSIILRLKDAIRSL